MRMLSHVKLLGPDSVEADGAVGGGQVPVFRGVWRGPSTVHPLAHLTAEPAAGGQVYYYY